MTDTGSQNKPTNWVLVADESRAIVYTRDTSKAPLLELFTMENPEARKKPGERHTDTGGRSFDSHGKGRHTMTKEKSASERQASIRFAKEISSRINKAVHSGSCRRFAVIAAPRFLGFIRQSLGTTGSATPELTIDKDVVGQDAEAIRKLLIEN